MNKPMNDQIIYIVQEGDYSQDEVVYAGFDKDYAYDANNFSPEQFCLSVTEWLDGKRIKCSWYNSTIEEWCD